MGIKLGTESKRGTQSRRTTFHVEGNRIVEYNAEGIQRLACAVIQEAVEDYTGRKWFEALKIFKPKKVIPKRKRTATLFLNKNTKGYHGKSMLEFCCDLAGVEISLIQKGAGIHDLSKRNSKNPSVCSCGHD